MSEDADSGMSKGRAEEELEIHCAQRKNRESARTWRPFICEVRRSGFYPVSCGINGHQHGDREKSLRQTRVCAGDVPGQEIKNRQTAENALQYDSADCGKAQSAQPLAPI